MCFKIWGATGKTLRFAKGKKKKKKKKAFIKTLCFDDGISDFLFDFRFFWRLNWTEGGGLKISET
jgi:hypothetical protein